MHTGAARVRDTVDDRGRKSLRLVSRSVVDQCVTRQPDERESQDARALPLVSVAVDDEVSVLRHRAQRPVPEGLPAK